MRLYKDMKDDIKDFEVNLDQKDIESLGVGDTEAPPAQAPPAHTAAHQGQETDPIVDSVLRERCGSFASVQGGERNSQGHGGGQHVGILGAGGIPQAGSSGLPVTGYGSV